MDRAFIAHGDELQQVAEGVEEVERGVAGGAEAARSFGGNTRGGEPLPKWVELVGGDLEGDMGVRPRRRGAVVALEEDVELQIAAAKLEVEGAVVGVGLGGALGAILQEGGPVEVANEGQTEEVDIEALGAL